MSKKISTEQLESLQKLVNNQNNIQTQIGGIEGHKMTLLDKLKEAVAELLVDQKKLEEEFGQVNIDLKTGEITDVPADDKKN